MHEVPSEKEGLVIGSRINPSKAESLSTGQVKAVYLILQDPSSSGPELLADKVTIGSTTKLCTSLEECMYYGHAKTASK